MQHGSTFNKPVKLHCPTSTLEDFSTPITSHRETTNQPSRRPRPHVIIHHPLRRNTWRAPRITLHPSTSKKTPRSNDSVLSTRPRKRPTPDDDGVRRRLFGEKRTRPSNKPLSFRVSAGSQPTQPVSTTNGGALTSSWNAHLRSAENNTARFTAGVTQAAQGGLIVTVESVCNEWCVVSVDARRKLWCGLVIGDQGRRTGDVTVGCEVFIPQPWFTVMTSRLSGMPSGLCVCALGSVLCEGGVVEKARKWVDNAQLIEQIKCMQGDKTTVEDSQQLESGNLVPVESESRGNQSSTFSNVSPHQTGARVTFQVCFIADDAFAVVKDKCEQYACFKINEEEKLTIGEWTTRLVDVDANRVPSQVIISMIEDHAPDDIVVGLRSVDPKQSLLILS